MGDCGRTSDGGVYVRSDLGRRMESKTLHEPPSTSLPGAAHLGDVPFVMVGDAAFPLKPYLMRPYPGQNHQKRIFNYRLSRARMVVENGFGILPSRWRIFHRKINLHPQNPPAGITSIVKSGCDQLRRPRSSQNVTRFCSVLRTASVSEAERFACHMFFDFLRFC